MTPHRRIEDTTRRSKKTLYVIAGFYVGVGFFVAAPAALSGDRLSAFLGFLIISGALGAAVVVNAVLRLGARLSAIGESLDDIHNRLEQIELTYPSTETSASPESSTRVIYLTSFGRGDPSVLAAARLDRSAFPRLVTTMEEAPSAEAAHGRHEEANDLDATGGSSQTAEVKRGEAPDTFDAADVTTKNLLREWKMGLRTGDVAACRRVFSAFVDTADLTIVAQLGAQLEALADRTERSLREAFAECARRRDYTGLLEIGDRICELLPDRPVAEEFKRIKPHLLGREQTPDGTPILRVVR